MHQGKQNSLAPESKHFDLLAHISQKKKEFQQADEIMQEVYNRALSGYRGVSESDKGHVKSQPPATANMDFKNQYLDRRNKSNLNNMDLNSINLLDESKGCSSWTQVNFADTMKTEDKLINLSQQFGTDTFSKRIFRKKTPMDFGDQAEDRTEELGNTEECQIPDWEVKETTDTLNLTSKHFHGLGQPPLPEQNDRPKTSQGLTDHESSSMTRTRVKRNTESQLSNPKDIDYLNKINGREKGSFHQSRHSKNSLKISSEMAADTRNSRVTPLKTEKMQKITKTQQYLNSSVLSQNRRRQAPLLGKMPESMDTSVHQRGSRNTISASNSQYGSTTQKESRAKKLAMNFIASVNSNSGLNSAGLGRNQNLGERISSSTRIKGVQGMTPKSTQKKDLTPFSREAKIPAGKVSSKYTISNPAQESRQGRTDTRRPYISRPEPLSTEQSGIVDIRASMKTKSMSKSPISQIRSPKVGLKGPSLNSINSASRKQTSTVRSSSNYRGGSMVRSNISRADSSNGSHYFQTKISGKAPPIQKLTGERIKQEMVEAFGKVRLDLYSDILRIKKPQIQAFTASQMLCKLVNSFRGGSQKSKNDILFNEWQAIQDFVHRKPNVIKFNQEITQLIQHMILSPDYLKQLRNSQLKNHLNKLVKIQTQYFGQNSQENVLKQFQTNKNFQIIVNICFTVTRYVLHEAGRLDLINMGSEPDGNGDNISNHSSLHSGNKMSVKSRQSLSNPRKVQTKFQRPEIAERGSSKSKHATPKNQLFKAQSGLSDFGSHKQNLNSRDKMASFRKSPGAAGKINGIKTPRNDQLRNNVSDKGKSPIQRFHMGRSSALGKISSGSKSFQVGELNPTPSKQDFACSLQKQGITPYCKRQVCSNSKSLTKTLMTSANQFDHHSSHKNLCAVSSQPLALVDEKPATNTRNLYELMLKKQKQISIDKYERLTLNSIQKKCRSGLNQSSGINTPNKAVISRGGQEEPVPVNQVQEIEAATLESIPVQRGHHRSKSRSQMNSPYREQNITKPMSPPKKYDTSFVENTETNVYADKQSGEGKSRKSRKDRKSSQGGGSISSLPPLHNKSLHQRGESSAVEIGDHEQDPLPTPCPLSIPPKNSATNNENSFRAQKVTSERSNSDFHATTKIQQNNDVETPYLNLPNEVLKTEQSETQCDNIMDQIQLGGPPAPTALPCQPEQMTHLPETQQLSSCHQSSLPTSQRQSITEHPLNDDQLLSFQPNGVVAHEESHEYYVDDTNEQTSRLEMTNDKSISHTEEEAPEVEEVPEPAQKSSLSSNISREDATDEQHCCNESNAQESDQMEFQEDNTESAEEESPMKQGSQSYSESSGSKSLDFDPYAEAEKIATIIRADCYQQLMLKRKQEEEEEFKEEPELNDEDEASEYRAVTNQDMRIAESEHGEPSPDKKVEMHRQILQNKFHMHRESATEFDIDQEAMAYEKSSAMNCDEPIMSQRTHQLSGYDEVALAQQEESANVEEESPDKYKLGFSKQNFEPAIIQQQNYFIDKRLSGTYSNSSQLKTIKRTHRTAVERSNDKMDLPAMGFAQEQNEEEFYGQKTPVHFEHLEGTEKQLNKSSKTNQPHVRHGTIYQMQIDESEQFSNFEKDAPAYCSLRQEKEFLRFEADTSKAGSDKVVPVSSGYHINEEFTEDGHVEQLEQEHERDDCERSPEVQRKTLLEIQGRNGDYDIPESPKTVSPQKISQLAHERGSCGMPSHFHHQSQEDIILQDISNIIVQTAQESEQEEEITPAKARDENVKQDPHGERSSENSEMCMQEIVSPFRQLNLSRSKNDKLQKLSPENRSQAFEATTWTINPVQVKREDMPEDQEERQPFGIVESDPEDQICQSPGGPFSPCESPIKRGDKGFCKTSGSPVISPGKIKSHISVKRAVILEQILAIEQEISENSPSRHSQIDHSMIQRLKENRLKQRSLQPIKKVATEQENLVISPSKENSRPSSPQTKSPETIISRIRKSFERQRIPFQVRKQHVNLVQI